MGLPEVAQLSSASTPTCKHPFPGVILKALCSGLGPDHILTRSDSLPGKGGLGGQSDGSPVWETGPVSSYPFPPVYVQTPSLCSG